MKNAGKIAGMLLMLLIAGNLSLSAQRGGMRGMRPDSAGTNRMMMQHRQMPLMMQHPDSMKMGGMHHGRAPMHMRNMEQMMYPMWRMGRHAMYGMRQPGMGMRYPAHGIRIMDNIPNLTDKQKKDIADLRQKQQEEMKKIRDENQAKIQSMRESHKTKVMNLLTDEQKKWIEGNTPEPIAK